jgi:perosamine synthetase
MIGPLTPFNSFGAYERAVVENFVYTAQEFGWPLSGFLAGEQRGGDNVRLLEDTWAAKFGVKHAIACNSATSGLLAAADAVGLDHESVYACPTLTMSATVAAPRVLGATPSFIDAESVYYGMQLPLMKRRPHAVFITSLFGHPANLLPLRQWCDENDIYMIEDAAQAPFAMDNGKYVGTIGHIGVFSFNVHKPLQAGEGGMIVTNEDRLAERLRGFINHGEHLGQDAGLNLRMTEISAAIALVQLRRATEIIGGRVAQAEALLSAINTVIPGIFGPHIRSHCTHVYYALSFQIAERRAEFCELLRRQGVPVTEGYTLAHRLPAFGKFKRDLPEAERLHDRSLFYFENCAWDLTAEQIGDIGAAFRLAAEKVL